MLMIYFKRTGKQRPNFEGNSGTKATFWNREHKKTFFFHFGEQANLFQGNRYPPWEGPGEGAFAGQLCTDA